MARVGITPAAAGRGRCAFTLEGARSGLCCLRRPLAAEGGEAPGRLARVSLPGRRFVCASPDDFRSHPPPKTPADLRHHKIIATGDAAPGTEWRFGEGRGDMVRLKPRLTVSNEGAALDLAREGWGVTRALSYQIGPDLQAGRLQTVLDGFETERMPVHLVHQEGRRVTAKLRCFLDFARDRLRGLPVLQG